MHRTGTWESLFLVMTFFWWVSHPDREVYGALLTEYRVLMTHGMALLTVCRAFMREYRACLREYRALLQLGSCDRIWGIKDR